MSSRRRKRGRRRRRRRFMSDSVGRCELCKSVRKIPVSRHSSRRWREGLRLDAPRVAVLLCLELGCLYSHQADIRRRPECCVFCGRRRGLDQKKSTTTYIYTVTRDHHLHAHAWPRPLRPRRQGARPDAPRGPDAPSLRDRHRGAAKRVAKAPSSNLVLVLV